MTWFRNTAALAAGAALMLAPQVLPAASTAQSASVVAAASSRVTSKPLIQGVVTDQFGRYVDGVVVQATREDGTPAAAAETYASRWADGPQHGYFFVEAPGGTYTLTLSKPGYETAVYDDVQLGRRGKVSLGEIEIQKILATTATTALLTGRNTTTRDRATVVVAVTSRSTKKPTGAVEVREGRKVVGSAVLKPGNQGNVTVTLERLAKGTHVLRAYFLGSDSLVASSSKRTVTLVVGKSKK